MLTDKQIAEALDNGGEDFTSKLIQLIHVANEQERLSLGDIFPTTMRAYLRFIEEIEGKRMTDTNARPVKPSWGYGSDATYVMGPRFKHGMNGVVCYGPWAYITFPDGGHAYYCEKCSVGIHDSEKAMFGDLKKAHDSMLNPGRKPRKETLKSNGNYGYVVTEFG
jgi:hypothetical protein